MKFETLLARRYIGAQKRHTALTACSIVIAVALITMLCSCFTTLRGIQHAASYDAQPYHVMFYEVTKNQGAAIAHMNQVASCELKQNPDGVTYQAQVIFGEYIDDHWVYLESMIRELKLNASISRTPKVIEGMEINNTLMRYDLVTLDGRFEAVQMIALFFIFLIFFALALRMIIDTAFEVSSKERERQFGVLQSIGATPQQIVRILTAEGMILSAIGVPFGVGLGLLLGFTAYRAVLTSGIAEVYFTTEKAEQLVHFHINPWITAAGGIIGLFWVFFSAYGTGMRIIKKSPVQAITTRSDTVKKVKKHSVLSLLFGWTGKIASRSARRQPKRFAVTVLSLTVSLTLFASISSAFRTAEDVITDTWTMYDEYGKVQSDFHLSLNMSDSDDIGFQKPTAYTEGVKQLSDTGYFKNIEYEILQFGRTSFADSEKEKVIYISYINRTLYERLFGENPEVSYDELTKSGGGILMNVDETIMPADTKTLSMAIRTRHSADEEEYERIRAEESDSDTRKVYDAYAFKDDPNEHFYYTEGFEETEFTIVSRYTQEDRQLSEGIQWEAYSMLIFTVEQWLNGEWERYGDLMHMVRLNCQLANDSDYESAKHFLSENKVRYSYSPEDPLTDNYGHFKRIRTTLAAVNIGLNAVLLMVALIAIVNMVNIVSTGVLNRKQELAAMQCLGMTRGQMYRTVIIECLQFTLWAAAAASILCFLLLNSTELFMKYIALEEVAENMLFSYGEPILKVWLASAAAFICALAASLLPLHNMQKEPLVEQIRAVE